LICVAAAVAGIHNINATDKSRPSPAVQYFEP